MRKGGSVAKKKQRVFNVEAVVTTWVTLAVTGVNNLDEALEYAKGLSAGDFVSAHGDVIEQRMTLSAVHDDTVENGVYER